MDSVFALQALNPGFREAFKQIVALDTNYTTETDRNIARTNDSASWKPHKHVLFYVPHLNEVEVILISEDTALNHLNELFNIEKRIGLIVMGPVIHRKKRPSLIVLTTSFKYIVIDPNNARAMFFFRAQLQKRDLHFNLSNALWEADCLKHNFDIDLTKVKARVSCASGSHLHIIQFMQHLSAASISKYPLMAKIQADYAPKIEKFDELVEMWLDVHKKHIGFDHAQLVHLTTRPLSTAAINIIKKRCCLVVILNQVIEYFSMIEFEFASESVHNVLTLGNAAITEDLLDELGICDGDADDKPASELEMLCYYSNFGSGLATDKFKIIEEKIEYEDENESDYE